MLKKCLKYDFRSVFRLWWIMAVSMLGAAVVAGLGIRFFTQCAASPDVPEGLLVLSSFAMIGSMFCIMAMVMGMTVSFILVFWRMYTHFYTDEGYLTFTLPAHSWQIFLSSLVNILIWTLIIMVVTAVSVFSIFLIGFVGVPEIEEALSQVNFSHEMEFLRDEFDIVMIIYGVVEFVTSAVIMMTCITLGSVLAKKHKIMASIGVYYLWSLIMGIISTQLLGGALLNSVEVDFSRVYLIETALALATAMGGFLLSTWIMDKKLNLP